MIIVIDTEGEVLHEITLIIKIIHKIDTVPHPETNYIMTKVLLLHNTLDYEIHIQKRFSILSFAIQNFI